jgi:hypothetical protein
MNELIDKIFKSYKYIEVADIGRSNIAFYKHECAEIANYFLVYTIDCREFEENEEQIKRALEQLEKEYSKSTNPDNCSLKQQIIESFNNIKEASQVDKNTSAIYLLLFENIENLNKCRNTVYSIEESPNYFKKYVLPYTQNQLNQLNNELFQISDGLLNDALCQIVDSEDGYFKLVGGKDLESAYGLAIRMFSKLPFLQYKFKTEMAPEPIEKRVEGNLKAELIKHHNILKDNKLTIENILELEGDFKLENDELDKEIKKLLKGVKS